MYKHIEEDDTCHNYPVYRIQHEDFKLSAEISSSSSESTKPKFDTTLNFMNPNSPDVAKVSLQSGTTEVPLMDGITSLQEAIDSVNGTGGYLLNDNGVPFSYDLSGKTLSFGLNQASSVVPTPEQLFNPANYYLAKMEKSGDTQENSETGVRFDLEVYVDDSIITSVDLGYRFNASSSEFHKYKDTWSTSDQAKSISGTLISDLLVKGPNNFGDGDDRELFIKDFLLVDPDKAFSDPEGTLATIDKAYNVTLGTSDSATMDVSEDRGAFYLVEEETHALYAQANFEWEMIRGNVGGRYISTEVDSISNYDVGVQSILSGDYSFFLPRLNVVADVADDMAIRFGASKDIRRPNFDQLSAAFDFGTNENTAVALGNPGLEPEEVVSLDLSWEWYFAEASIVSVGYFTKERTNIFGIKTYEAPQTPSTETTSGFVRETALDCPGGGIYNPNVVANTLGELGAVGMCVDYSEPSNDSETTTVSGWEFSAQYDLAGFEDELGWASGFGVAANYTIQDFKGGSTEDCTGGRGKNVLGDICAERGLEDFSENAYNLTAYYERNGLSARMRYTWRDAFKSTDFAGGSSTNSTLSFPVVTAARGQLNASVSYDVTDKLNIGLEAVNLTNEGIKQYCVNDDALLCFVGLPDRRVTFGASYRF